MVMTDKEKLEALLTDDYCPLLYMQGGVGNLANYLIKRGVTVQRWIPASEPPEEYRDEYGELIPFLACSEETEYPFRALYDGKTWGDGIFIISVTHWMPLPESPKGE